MIFIDVNLSEIDEHLNPYVQSVCNYFIDQNASFSRNKNSWAQKRIREFKQFFRNALLYKWYCGYKISWITKALVVRSINGISKFTTFQIPSQTPIIGKVIRKKEHIYKEDLNAYLFKYIKDFIVSILKNSLYKTILDQNLDEIKQCLFNLKREILIESVFPYYADIDLDLFDFKESFIFVEILDPYTDSYPQLSMEIDNCDYTNETKDGTNDLIEELRTILYHANWSLGLSSDTGSPPNAYVDDPVYLTQPYTYDPCSRTLSPDDQCVYNLEYDGYQWTIPGGNIEDECRIDKDETLYSNDYNYEQDIKYE